jgi:hypothetical protein
MKFQLPLLLCISTFILIQSCSNPEQEVAEAHFPDISEDISCELILKSDSSLQFFNIEEIKGRKSLLIHQGEAGVESNKYEEYDTSRTALIQIANKLYAEKIKEGFRAIKPDDFKSLIIQFDSAQIHRNFKEDSIVFIMDIIHDLLSNHGNGVCNKYDLNQHSLNYFAAVLKPEIAFRSILSELKSNGIKLQAVFAIEDKGEVNVIYPEDFQGVFQYH